MRLGSGVVHYFRGEDEEKKEKIISPGIESKFEEEKVKEKVTADKEKMENDIQKKSRTDIQKNIMILLDIFY